jgi:hypothetical protein
VTKRHDGAGLRARKGEKGHPQRAETWKRDRNQGNGGGGRQLNVVRRVGSEKGAAVRAPIVTGTRLMVTNLDPDIVDEDLLQVFSSVGKVASARIFKDAAGKSKGSGEVVYRKRVDADSAVAEFDERDVNGLIIRVHILGTQVISGGGGAHTAAVAASTGGDGESEEVHFRVTLPNQGRRAVRREPTNETAPAVSAHPLSRRHAAREGRSGSGAGRSGGRWKRDRGAGADGTAEAGTRGGGHRGGGYGRKRGERKAASPPVDLEKEMEQYMSKRD